jgi:transposase
MCALEPEVVDAVWTAVEALLPRPPIDGHPLGYHRPRVPDRLCFEGILIRLVTGCSWVDAERLIGGMASDTMLRARRDEGDEAGVFDALSAEAICAYDKIIGLDLSESSVDGPSTKLPVEARGRAKTLRIGANSAGSGRCSPSGAASPLRGRSTVPIVTTSLFTPTLEAAAHGDFFVTSRHSTSTEAMTALGSDPSAPGVTSTTSCAPISGATTNLAVAEGQHLDSSGCVGLSRG